MCFLEKHEKADGYSSKPVIKEANGRSRIILFSYIDFSCMLSTFRSSLQFAIGLLLHIVYAGMHFIRRFCNPLAGVIATK